MSSFIRTIERTRTRVLKHRKGRHYMGRGSRLGVTNPKDPCIHPQYKKKPKPWRPKAHAPGPKE